MAKWFTAIIQFIAALMGYIRERQLMDAGRDKEKLDVLKNSDKARKKAREIVKDTGTLPSDIVSERLSKYKRKK